MTPKLSKTLKVSPETQYHLKLLAAQRCVSMAQLVENLVKQAQSYHDDNEYRYTLDPTPEQVKEFLASYEQRGNWPIQTVRLHQHE